MRDASRGSVDEIAARLAQELVRDSVRALSAYHVEPADGLVKLDAMENPYRWPAQMIEEWLRTLRTVPVNRYPDAGARELKRGLRAALGIPEACGLVLGNGSDELIQLLALCLGGPGRTVLAPDPTFVMYRMLSSATGGTFVPVPLHPDSFALDLDAMLNAIAQYRPSLVFLAYPNNPTGNLFSRDQIEEVIEAAPGVVVVDEAYEPFARVSFLDRLDAFPNLMVMRTLSKLGLAGLRLGLLVASPSGIDELEKLRLPYNINCLTQASAEFALEHYDVFEAQAASIRDERTRVIQTLQRFEGLTVWTSDANFVLCRYDGGDARALGRALRDRGVLIRVLDGSAPALAGCVRVSVGTPEENTALFGALEACL